MENNVREIMNQKKIEESNQRFFEKISFEQFKKDIIKMFDDKYNEEKIKEIYSKVRIPKRGSKNSAGYDFTSPLEFSLEPNEVKVIPTGIKASMNNDEALMMYIRSSIGFKYNVRLTNQTGVIDSDYYNNKNNEGHIMISFHNHGKKTWEVKYENKNIRVAQGIFMKYLLIKDDDSSKERRGGIGSTN